MPVELSRIRLPQKKPPRPRTRRWLIFGVFLLVVTAGAVILLWKGERTGIHFWVLAVVMPVLVWGALFIGRRTGYKLKGRGAYANNKIIEHRHHSETARGQRFAWLQGEYLINGLEPGKATHLAALDQSPVLQPLAPRGGGDPVRHAAISGEGTSAALFQKKLQELAVQINLQLENIPAKMTCYFAIDGDEVVGDFSEALRALIPRNLVRIRDLTGLRIVDYWLDHHYDKASALLIVSAQFREAPQTGEGEAMAALLLTNCRLEGSSVRLHRPQLSREGNLSHAMKRVMLWAGLSAEAPLRGWLSGGKLATEDQFSQAAEQHAPKMDAKRCVYVDTVAGFAGATAPWQTTILASRQALIDDEPQMAVIETTADTWQLCVVTIKE